MIDERVKHYEFFYDGLKIGTYKTLEEAIRKKNYYKKLYGIEKEFIITFVEPVLIQNKNNYKGG